MFILRNILTPLQSKYSATSLGRQRSQWFIYALLAFIVPFYGVKQASMVQPVASIMEYDSNSGNGWPFVGRPG